MQSEASLGKKKGQFLVTLSLALSLIIASSLVNLKTVYTPMLIYDPLQPCHIFSVQVLNACVPKDSLRRKVSSKLILLSSALLLFLIVVRT